MERHIAWLNSPIGTVRIVSDTHAVQTVSLASSSEPSTAVAPARLDTPAARAAEQLAAYFDGQRHGFELVFAPTGSDFQRRVWACLETIGHGELVSYGEIATAIGHAGAARAVGRANATNPIPLLIPCHRVIGADGRLTGYSGGMERKIALLRHEGHVVNTDGATPRVERRAPVA